MEERDRGEVWRRGMEERNGKMEILCAERFNTHATDRSNQSIPLIIPTIIPPAIHPSRDF